MNRTPIEAPGNNPEPACIITDPRSERGSSARCSSTGRAVLPDRNPRIERSLLKMHSPLPGAAALAALLFGASPARAQSLAGGQQSFVWSADCVTDQVLTNNTMLSLAGLWLAIDVVGMSSPPEIGTIRALSGVLLWDVDDNEDLDNDDVGENDLVDSTPNGSSGWHRVQARTDAALVAPGGTLSLRLCDLNGNSVAGRTIFVIPIAQKAGQTGGDQGARVQPPLGLNRQTFTGLVTIGSTGAPPNSVDFSFGMVNLDPSLPFRKLMLTPPPGVTIVAASGSSGGNYNPSLRTIVWPTPIPPGCIEQINTTVNMLTLSTTVAYTFVSKLRTSP